MIFSSSLNGCSIGEGNEMELDSVKRYLEKGAGEADKNASIANLPHRFFDSFIMQGLRVDLIEPGRLVCSMNVPSRMLNANNFFHGGAMVAILDLVSSAVMFTVGLGRTGVSVDINVSYLDAAYVEEEIEIEAKGLRVGKATGVVSVDFRKKETGKIIAQGRHTKFHGVASKL